MSDRHILEHSVPPPPSKLHNHIFTKADPESFAFLKKKTMLQLIYKISILSTVSFPIPLPLYHPQVFKKGNVLLRQLLHHLIMIYFLIIVTLGFAGSS